VEQVQVIDAARGGIADELPPAPPALPAPDLATNGRLLDLPAPPSALWKRPFHLLRRGVRLLLRPWLGAQAEFNRGVVDTLRDTRALLTAHLEQLHHRSLALHDALIAHRGALQDLGAYVHADRAPAEIPPAAALTERLLERVFVHTRLPRPPARVLELGGAASINAVEMATLGFQVVCVDAAPPAFAHPHLESRAADWERLPFGDGAFDAVVSLCLGERGLARGAAGRAVLREAARVLRPEGRFLVSVPCGAGGCGATVDWLMPIFRVVEIVFGIRAGPSWTCTLDRAAAERAGGPAVALVMAERP
jgi:SAM-dependent methyltransferase